MAQIRSLSLANLAAGIPKPKAVEFKDSTVDVYVTTPRRHRVSYRRYHCEAKQKGIQGSENENAPMGRL